jgi:hypothetical protein
MKKINKCSLTITGVTMEDEVKYLQKINPFRDQNEFILASQHGGESLKIYFETATYPECSGAISKNDLRFLKRKIISKYLITLAKYSGGAHVRTDYLFVS